MYSIECIKTNFNYKFQCAGDNQELLKLIDYNKNVDLPNFNEMETTYKYPPLTGVLAKILWINGEASGFYIVRLKGLILKNISCNFFL